jgi:hypothetical protein
LSRRCLAVGSTPDSGETPLALCENWILINHVKPSASNWGKLPLFTQAAQLQ